MSYTHILVAVAVTPESHQLVAKAVSIARPCSGKNKSDYPCFRS
ncbi:Universal stress protein A [Salmonella enterica subsp. houtenae]|nr:Universal stress protein A [Salmonella enterica subsp. houtenae]